MDFLLLLITIVWVIYTFDHIIDGINVKGQSGILRYDLHYQYRRTFIPICILLFFVIAYIIYKNHSHIFILNGYWLLPLIVVYFILKLKGNIKPIAKMAYISFVVSMVIVSLYSSEGLFIESFKAERIIVMLLVFLNQLILEHYEFHEEQLIKQPATAKTYYILSIRVFIWISVFLAISTFLNSYSWPYTLTIFIISLLLFAVIYFQKWFSEARRYRFWADFSFVLFWPILKLVMYLKGLF